MGLWGKGPWVDEPDLVEWVDPITELTCIINRSETGEFWGLVRIRTHARGRLPDKMFREKSIVKVMGREGLWVETPVCDWLSISPDRKLTLEEKEQGLDTPYYHEVVDAKQGTEYQAMKIKEWLKTVLPNPRS